MPGNALVRPDGASRWKPASAWLSEMMEVQPPAFIGHESTPMAGAPGPPSVPIVEMTQAGMPFASTPGGSIGLGLRQHRPLPQPDAQATKMAVSASSVVPAVLTFGGLLLDGLLWTVLGVLKFKRDLALMQSGQTDPTTLLPREIAASMVWSLPVPLLGLIPLIVVSILPLSQVPDHARPYSIFQPAIRWALLSIAPIGLYLLIKILPADSTRLPFMIASFGIFLTTFCAVIPREVNNALNARLSYFDHEVPTWAGTSATGLLMTSSIFAALLNILLFFMIRGEVAQSRSDAPMASLLIIGLFVIAVGARLVGMLLTGIWAMLLVSKLRKIPATAVTSRRRWE
jgi:hypothetical protein